MILGAGGMTTVHCNCNRTLCVLRLVWQWLQCASKGLWEIDLRISVVWWGWLGKWRGWLVFVGGRMFSIRCAVSYVYMCAKMWQWGEWCSVCVLER